MADHRFAPFDLKANLVKTVEATPKFKLSDPLEHPELQEMGVYLLFLEDNESPIYVGKTDKDGSLAKRLREHRDKIAGRHNIEVSQVNYRFVTVAEVWLVRACEEFLIEHYETEWQGSGFGSHVPGRGRPGVRASRWDTLYPPRPTTDERGSGVRPEDIPREAAPRRRSRAR